MKKKCEGKILSVQELACDIFDMWIETSIAKDAKSGQFIGVFPKNQATLLPRPTSICEVDKEKSALRPVYRIAGKGTKEDKQRYTAQLKSTIEKIRQETANKKQQVTQTSQVERKKISEEASNKKKEITAKESAKLKGKKSEIKAKYEQKKDEVYNGIKGGK